MSNVAPSFNQGQRDGAVWLKKAKHSSVSQRLNPLCNPKPHRDGECNRGVDKDIKNGGGNRVF